jgi:hypothetical protein
LIGSIGPAPTIVRAFAIVPLGCTSALAGSTATITCKEADDTLLFDQSGGLLRHNLFSQGHAGFSSDFDFNSTAPSDQTLSATATNVQINILAGDGDDEITIGSSSAPKSGLAAQFNINGEANNDQVTINNEADVADDVVDINASVVSFIGGPVAYSNVDVLVVNSGSGNDLIEIKATGSTTTIVNAGGGDDNVFLGNLVNLNGGYLDGGTGKNYLDYSEWNAGVQVDLRTTHQLFIARISARQEPGPRSNSPGFGRGIFRYIPAETALTFDVQFQGLVGATVTGAHFHNAPVNVNGPIVRGVPPAISFDDTPPFGFYTGVWTASDSAPLTPALVTELLANRIYFNIHTNLFPSGEVRGQLILQGDFGSATGTNGVRNFDNVVGGLGNDFLTGNANANEILGFSGNDTLTGGPGADLVLGLLGTDTLIWNDGDGSDVVLSGGVQAGVVDTVRINGSDTGGDVFSVTPNGDRIAFQRTNLDLVALDIASTERLELNGLGGDDTFNVRSLPFAAIVVDGGVGTDTLNVDPGCNCAAVQGNIVSVCNDEDVTFTNVENVNIASAFFFFITTPTILESEGLATIRVERFNSTNTINTINYATSNGSATAGSDYTATTGTLTFNPGDKFQTFTVPITDDAADEGDESLVITLSGGTGFVASCTGITSTLTILDNDPLPTLSISDVTVTEGNAGSVNAVFTVTLSALNTQTVTVDFLSSNGTASSPGDYSPVSGTLTFNPGQTTRTIVVPVNGDATPEPDEIFFVNLLNPTNATINDGQGIGTITNDDVPATVGLTSSTFTVGENAQRLTVNVTRTGDTTVAGSVAYATSDGFGFANCNVVNGSASERCDYSTTIGVLQFAAGETSKSFDIFITDDSHVEGNEVFNISLSNATGFALSGTTSATITITDNDSAPSSQNPIDGVEFFVRQQYVDFLAREPDQQGFQNWVNTLANCPNGGFGLNNPQCDRVRVASGFYPSVEFGERGYFVYRFFDAALGRLPQYREFVRDLNRVGGSQSPQQSELSKQAFIADFMASPEFQAIYGGLTTPAQAAGFIGKLEQRAGVTLPEPQRSQLINQMQTGQKTAAQVLREFIESQVVFDRFFNRGFVSLLYFGFQRRDPDPVGFQNWLTQINQTGDTRPIVFGFIYSAEYRSRFGQP